MLVNHRLCLCFFFFFFFFKDTREAAIVDSGTETMPDFVDIIEKKQCVVSPCACVPVPEYVCVWGGASLPFPFSLCFL